MVTFFMPVSCFLRVLLAPGPTVTVPSETTVTRGDTETRIHARPTGPRAGFGYRDKASIEPVPG